jgi:histidinol-phosphate phosphatase family protein
LILKQVVIFVGGLGTRLGHITKTTPKPLIKINGVKFLDILIDNLSRFGFSKIILLTSYKFSIFKKNYHKKKINNSQIICLNEGSPKGTGGALLNSLKYFDDFFLLCNGDTYLNINFHDLFLNSNKKKIFNVAITKKNTQKRFSHVKINKKLITEFNTKSGVFINTGHYIVNKKKLIMQKFNKEKSSLENNILPNLVKKKECSYVKYKTPILDIGVKKDLKNAPIFINKSHVKKAAILDRDGVINYDFGYVSKIKDFKLKPKVIKFIKFLNDNNYFVFVVSNQSGVGRGYYTENDVKQLHNHLNEKLKINGAYIDEFFISPYYKSSKFQKYQKDANLRKPNIGLFKRIKKQYLIKTKGSFMVGDQNSDYFFAKNAGIKYFDINKFKSIFELRSFINF